jgi:hypothetical protein
VDIEKELAAVPGVASVLAGGVLALSAGTTWWLWLVASAVSAGGFALLARRLTRSSSVLALAAVAGPFYVLGLYLQDHIDAPALLTVAVAALCLLVGMLPASLMLVLQEERRAN